MDTEEKKKPANAEEEPKPEEPPEPPPMKIVPPLPKQYELKIPEQDLPENLYDMSEKIDKVNGELFDRVQAMDNEDAYRDAQMQQIYTQYGEIQRAQEAAAAPTQSRSTTPAQGDNLTPYFTLPTQQGTPQNIVPFQYTTAKEVAFDSNITEYRFEIPYREKIDDPVISISSVPEEIPKFTPKPSIVQSYRNPWFAHPSGYKLKIVLVIIILLLTLILVALIFYFMASLIFKKKNISPV